jgi:uncharacterized membrane-anchored protein YhcB (DUF1043 family)
MKNEIPQFNYKPYKQKKTKAEIQKNKAQYDRFRKNIESEFTPEELFQMFVDARLIFNY